MSVRMRRQLSPTAQLLRSSRLFSIPNPLPAPNMDISVSGTLKSSNTATLPYPTHQAITTPASSLGRGDWGLKRPLPLKSTKSTSKPVLRILNNDTIEHITDFDSAQDHVQTLQKWQEMGVALVMSGKPERDPSKLFVNQKGVFERLSDSTDPKDQYGMRNSTNQATKPMNALRKSIRGKRWKYNGPWLASMDAKAFQIYVKNNISQRQEAFQAYFREYIRQKVAKARGLDTRDKGRDLKESDYELSDDDLKVHYRLFRQGVQESPISSELIENVIIPFLDLPPMGIEPATQLSGGTDDQHTVSDSGIPFSTHPSAGLSYLRTNSYLYNHPLLGPQQYKTPVPGRVLTPAKFSRGGGRGRAMLGVAGIAVDDPEVETKMGGGKHGTTGSAQLLDTETEGGKKVWVSPISANITPQGKIKLDITRAASEAIGVGLGQVEEALPPGVKKAPSITPFETARLDEPLA